MSLVFSVIALFAFALFGILLLFFVRRKLKLHSFIEALQEGDKLNEILEEERSSKFKGGSNSYGVIKSKLIYAGFEQTNAHILFFLISFGCGTLFGLIISLLIQNIIIFLIMFGIGTLIPYWIILQLIEKRKQEFNTNLIIMIDKITSLMKSGIGFDQAFKKTIDGTKSQITKAIFDLYLREKDIIGEEKAFLKLIPLVDSKELRIFYLTVSIGRQSGGKFSEMFEKLRDSLQEQSEIHQELLVATREVRVGIYFLLVLILFVYFMLNQGLNNILNEHFFGSEIGRTQMFFILLWVGIGMFVNSKLVKIQ